MFGISAVRVGSGAAEHCRVREHMAPPTRKRRRCMLTIAQRTAVQELLRNQQSAVSTPGIQILTSSSPWHVVA